MCQLLGYGWDMTTDARWLTDEEQRVWRQWLLLGDRMTATLARQLQEESGMSLPDFEVLVRLSEAPDERVRVLALAQILRWERSRLSHHLTRMERRGLIRRQDCPSDRRGAYAVLTDHGRTTIEQAAPGHVNAVREVLFDRLDEGELATLDHLTGTLLFGLEDAAGADAADIAAGCAESSDPCTAAIESGGSGGAF